MPLSRPTLAPFARVPGLDFQVLFGPAIDICFYREKSQIGGRRPLSLAPDWVLMEISGWHF